MKAKEKVPIFEGGTIVSKKSRASRVTGQPRGSTEVRAMIVGTAQKPMTPDERRAVIYATIRVLLRGEEAGALKEGPWLTELWDLIAAAHIDLYRLECNQRPEFDLERLTRRRRN